MKVYLSLPARPLSTPSPKGERGLARETKSTYHPNHTYVAKFNLVIIVSSVVDAPFIIAFFSGRYMPHSRLLLLMFGDYKLCYNNMQWTLTRLSKICPGPTELHAI